MTMNFTDGSEYMMSNDKKQAQSTKIFFGFFKPEINKKRTPEFR